MSFTCLVFDDETSAIAEVSFLIGKYGPNWKILGIASTIDMCKELLKSHKSVNVIFSDIHFGNEIIFDVLPELNSFKGNIVFITGDNGFASQAFQLSATDYILKPINEDQFNKSLRKFENIMVGENFVPTNDILYHNLKTENLEFKKIAFNTSSGYVIKDICDILYAKSDNNYTQFFFTDNEKAYVAKTLLDYEKMLSKFGFFRIHQSYLVNFKHVVRFNTDVLELQLSNGENLPVSFRKRTLLLEMLRKVF
jgi:two-component system LytT family response regulator